ncbi:hydroxyisourate hydrolase [Acinetobacter sp. B51(2017)]|uniref:hydroxyisourate hydrolase n=1 Tax=Acinetobacter sp. B51(2017) TaxID=2060938 RepID=UPI000F0945F4|nr:hydroxyisourate hydrolase [Acinetobacter sp. B51(2017)]
MISTHILDTHLGKPAANVIVQLLDANGSILATAKTNADGRITSDAFALNEIQAGDYCLNFAVADYFKSLYINTFFPKAAIHFTVEDASQHYHIPLLINAFSYSTYRGS